MTGSPTLHHHKKALKRPAPRKAAKPVTASLLPSFAQMVSGILLIEFSFLLFFFVFIFQISWLMERNFKEIPVTKSTSSPTAVHPSAGFDRDDTPTDEYEEEDQFSDVNEATYNQLDENIDGSKLLNPRNTRSYDGVTKHLPDRSFECKQDDHINAKEQHSNRDQPKHRQLMQISSEKNPTRKKFHRTIIYPSAAGDQVNISATSIPGTSQQPSEEDIGSSVQSDWNIVSLVESEDASEQQPSATSTVTERSQSIEEEGKEDDKEAQLDEKRLSAQLEPPSLVRKFLEREYPGERYSNQYRLSAVESKSKTESGTYTLFEKGSRASTQHEVQSVSRSSLLTEQESVVSEGSSEQVEQTISSQASLPEETLFRKSSSGSRSLLRHGAAFSSRRPSSQSPMHASRRNLGWESMSQSEQRNLLDQLLLERIAAARPPEIDTYLSPQELLAQEPVKLYDIQRAYEPEQPHEDLVNELNMRRNLLETQSDWKNYLQERQPQLPDSQFNYAEDVNFPLQGPPIKQDSRFFRENTADIYDLENPITRPVEYIRPLGFNKFSDLPTDSSELAAMLTSESTEPFEFSSSLLLDHPDYQPDYHELSPVTMSESEFEDSSSTDEYFAEDHYDKSLRRAHRPRAYDEYGRPLVYDEYDRPRAYDEYDRPRAHDENGHPHAQDRYGRPLAYNEYGHPLAYDEYGHLRKLDEHGFPLPDDIYGHPRAFDEYGDPFTYDAHGRPLAFDEHGHPLKYDRYGHMHQRHKHGRRRYFDEHEHRQRQRMEGADEDLEPEVVKEVTYFMKPRRIAKRNLRYLRGGESDQNLLDYIKPYRRRKYGVGGRYSPLAYSSDDSFITSSERLLQRGPYRMTEPLARKKYDHPTRKAGREEVPPGDILPQGMAWADLPCHELITAKITPDDLEKIRKGTKPAAEIKVTKSGQIVVVQPSITPFVDDESRYPGEGLPDRPKGKEEGAEKEKMPPYSYPDKKLSEERRPKDEEEERYEIVTDYEAEFRPQEEAKSRDILQRKPATSDESAEHRSYATRQRLKRLLAGDDEEEEEPDEEEIYLEDGRHIADLSEEERLQFIAKKPKEKKKLDLDNFEGLDIEDLLELFETESEIDYFLEHGEFRPDKVTEKQHLLEEVKLKAVEAAKEEEDIGRRALQRDSFTIVRVSLLMVIFLYSFFFFFFVNFS